MADPIRELFGISALELFRGREFAVSHGPLTRLPAFMREGLLGSIESLCRGYTGALDVAGGRMDEGLQVPVADVNPWALLKLGLTVYFKDLRRVLPAAPAFLQELELALGIPISAGLSAFVNAPGSGLALHHDRFDQLLFQIRGSKRFRYLANRYVEQPSVQFTPFATAPLEWAQSYRHGFPRSTQALLEEQLETVELEPGSVIFMPGGLWHTTAEQPDHALSVVVSVRAPSRLDVALNLIRYYAAQSPAWREPAYHGWASEPELAEPEQRAFAQLFSELGERIKHLPTGDAFAALSLDSFNKGTLTEYPQGARFARFMRLPNASATFEEDAALGKLRCTVKGGAFNRPPVETVLAFEAQAQAIVEWVQHTDRAFSTSEICDRFDDFQTNEILGLLEGLARAGLIRPLPAVEWDEGS
ncbi:MAG: cupin-like domain-containing protein [Myxococcales bacterium]